MSTPWELYNEVSKNNNKDYSVYRCIDPVAISTGQPWYGENNVCPCDPTLSNQSGRGFTSCPLGITDNNSSTHFSQISSYPKQRQITGNLYGSDQWVPPQIQPNPIVRIGQNWRSVN